MTILVLVNNEDGTSSDEYADFNSLLKKLADENGVDDPQWIKCDCQMCDGKGYRHNDYGCFTFYELAKKGHLQIKTKEIITEYILE